VKIVTVLGTRPEIIRLSRVIATLDRSIDHVVVHTGQNFERTLSDLFFQEMEIRKPNYELGIKADTAGQQIARILENCEQVFATEQPDRLLILGDTNSALCAIVAKRMAIPVFHMEAGNRCYDDRVPEEVNRRLIDHSSDVLMPYTSRSRANLLREGIASDRIYVTGNPILEVIEHYRQQIENADVIDRLGLKPGGFFLVTLHRAENVDVESRLLSFTKALTLLSERRSLPVIVSVHPRTAARMKQFEIDIGRGNVRFLEPFGFFDFIRLEKNAACVLSDSGTVQEECAIFGVPNVTLRDVTERPETIECGSNILSGSAPESIISCVDTVLQTPPNWTAPPEYLVRNVSEIVKRIVTGYAPHVKSWS
jgi:UDP-N-acetylglucosamine 2-epimerase (non-hydrolysing)